MIEEIKGLISGVTQKKLNAMSYNELTQSEFEEKVKLLNC
jgi:hypothetical protein